MNKLIIFDLDGVLVDSKKIHFDALNLALESISPDLVISEEEHKNIYEGISTKQKLKILTERKGLSQFLYKDIFDYKQKITSEMLNELQHDDNLVKYFNYIKENNINIAVASNSIKDTIDICLKKLKVYDLVDLILSNEDVKYPKPHPEIYWKTMSHFGCLADNTVIFEDSIVGKVSARDSGAMLIEIKNRKDLDLYKIEKAIFMLNNQKLKWEDPSLNVLIPMAGAGSRFFEAGYTFPKPLIDVNGKPMIQAVVDSLGIKAKYTYIVQKEHYEKYSLQNVLNLITPECNIVQIDGITEGAAVTCLKAKEYINNDAPLILANSDQIVVWNSKEFMYDLYTKNADGGIATFKSTHPKWSYAKVNENNIVTEVAEKKPISDNATVGIYYWKHGSDFVKYAEQMIEKNIRVNNEFYTCPVFNEAIQEEKRIYSFPVEQMWGVGTPEDLNYYLLTRNKIKYE